MISANRLREVLDYDPETGVFKWRISCGTARAGNIAGNLRHGYWKIHVDGHAFSAHRLAWLSVYGSVPKELDHKDGDKLNNRIANLREATRSQNCANKHARRNGLKGVYWHKQRQIWRAVLQLYGRKFHLGEFATEAEAHAAYRAAAEVHHGEFARAS